MSPLCLVFFRHVSLPAYPTLFQRIIYCLLFILTISNLCLPTHDFISFPSIPTLISCQFKYHPGFFMRYSIFSLFMSLVSTVAHTLDLHLVFILVHPTDQTHATPLPPDSTQPKSYSPPNPSFLFPVHVHDRQYPSYQPYVPNLIIHPLQLCFVTTIHSDSLVYSLFTI